MSIILVYNRMSDREDIKFFKVTKKTGHETHHLLYRFDRRKVGKNGLGYFSCSNRHCRASLSAVYVENEDPVVKNILNINDHILKTTGLEHFVCYSEEYISTCKERILLEIRRSPERPVLQIYEDCLNEFFRL